MEWDLVTLRAAFLGCWPQQLNKQSATRAIKAGEVERAAPVATIATDTDSGCGVGEKRGPPDRGRELTWCTERNPGKTLQMQRQTPPPPPCDQRGRRPYREVLKGLTFAALSVTFMNFHVPDIGPTRARRHQASGTSGRLTCCAGAARSGGTRHRCSSPCTRCPLHARVARLPLTVVQSSSPRSRLCRACAVPSDPYRKHHLM